MIRLRFVAHPGPFNFLVKVAQYGFWCSHSEAVMPDGRLLGARFIGGVQARAPDYDAGAFLRELFVSIRASARQAEVFYDFLTRQIGKPYDSLAILTFYCGREWQSPESWFCSELQAAALAACGLFPAEMAVGFGKITPRDLLLLAGALAGDAG